MSNFIEEFLKGQEGQNQGLFMGEGLQHLNNAINGIQKGKIYGIASPPKTGKTTLVDYAFVIQPYLYSIENNINIEWIYFSYEIDRISKEFDFASFFLNHDYKKTHVTLDNQNYTQNGIQSNKVEISSDYLRGVLKDDNGNIIKVKPSVLEGLKQVYENRIIPLFGEYNSKGECIKDGKMKVFTNKENPTGIYNFLLEYAKQNGTFITKKYGEKERYISYIPDDPAKHTIIVIDHMRKLMPERNFTMKQVVDKMSEYAVEIRNLCNFTFVVVIHTNRSITDPERLKLAKDMLYPTAEDIKDSGNISEDCDYLLTMFNPNDERYKLSRHFGIDIRDQNGTKLYPNLRTIHLVESRHCIYPLHFRVNMYGNIKKFEMIKK
jgi:hypothetical protein